MHRAGNPGRRKNPGGRTGGHPPGLKGCRCRNRTFGKHCELIIGRLGDGGKGIQWGGAGNQLFGGSDCGEQLRPIWPLSNCYLPQALSCTLKFFWDSGVGLSRSMSFLRSSSIVDLEVGLGDARRSLVEARSLAWAISLPSL